VGVALKKVQGVKAVEMKLNDGLARISLDSSNNVRIQDVRKVIETHGFSPQDARVTLHGKVIAQNGKIEIVVSHSQERLPLVFPEGMAELEQSIKQQEGEEITIEGRIPAVDDKQTSKIEFIGFKELK
jgi:hypothetical protein